MINYISQMNAAAAAVVVYVIIYIFEMKVQMPDGNLKQCRSKN